MTNYGYAETFFLIKITLILLLLSSCEDVIDVDVPISESRLVVEASIDWEKGTTGSEQSITLSLSTQFFDQPQLIPVNDAMVQVVKTNDNLTFSFNHTQKGVYTTNNFVPELNQEYQLNIIYKGESYLATETLKPVSEINRIEQSLEGGFDEELIDVSFYFDDPEEQDNFYFIRFERISEPVYQELEVDNDEFTNGNEIEEFYEIQDDEQGQTPLRPGDEIQISLHGVSEQYFNYIGQLIELSSNNGNPFTVTPAEIRGNVINSSNSSNYAFGYFRVTEKEVKNYIVE